MVRVIAENIIAAAQVVNGKPTNIEAGKAKYRTYFVKYTWYARYKESVDTYLVASGCAECIVTK